MVKQKNQVEGTCTTSNKEEEKKDGNSSIVLDDPHFMFLQEMIATGTKGTDANHQETEEAEKDNTSVASDDKKAKKKEFGMPMTRVGSR
jgi:hypothetical protein